MADLFVEEELPRSQSIYSVMEIILDEINKTYFENEIDLPSKQFFDLGGRGEVPHDCEQVTVSFEQLYTGMPGNPEQTPTSCDTARSGVFICEVVRCTPTAKPATRGGRIELPTPEAISHTTKEQVADVWLLMDAGLRAAQAVNFIGGIADVTVTPESGGYQAVVLSLIIGIP